jgi:hypothetical protein
MSLECAVALGEANELETRTEEFWRRARGAHSRARVRKRHCSSEKALFWEVIFEKGTELGAWFRRMAEIPTS